MGHAVSYLPHSNIIPQYGTVHPCHAQLHTSHTSLTQLAFTRLTMDLRTRYDARLSRGGQGSRKRNLYFIAGVCSSSLFSDGYYCFLAVKFIQPQFSL